MKTRIGNILNTRFNKSVYSAVVGASVDFVYGVLAEFHIDVSAGLQTKTLILAMALTALLVKNKNGHKNEPDQGPAETGET